jgi:hypothetical protein
MSLIKRIEAIHSTKCNKASDFGIAKNSYNRICASKEQIIKGIKAKRTPAEMKALYANIRKEWDIFMNQAPMVTEAEINRLMLNKK